MTVRAKFVCVSKGAPEGHSKDSKEVAVVLDAVTDGSEENKQFFKYTPSGKVVLNTINEMAADQFVVGKQYYADFTPAE